MKRSMSFTVVPLLVVTLASCGTPAALCGESTSRSGRAARGIATAGSGTTYGVYGQADSTGGTGVFGHAAAGSGTTYGVFGMFNSETDRGVYGLAPSANGASCGVCGQSQSASGYGVYGYVLAGSGENYGVYGQSNSNGGRGVYGYVPASSGEAVAVYGRAKSSSGTGVYGFADVSSGTNYGFRGSTNSVDGYGEPALDSVLAHQGTIYYVATTGDDNNPGTIDLPWQTIQKAANTLVAGDTVYIRAGTYPEQVIPQNSGSAGQVITYAAYPGETATLDGTGVVVPEYSGLFNLAGREYIRVSGLRVIHSAYYGIVADTSSHVTIEHNYTYDTYTSGISSWNSDHIIVAGNEVVGACTGTWQEHISISSTDTFEVRYNHIHDVMPGTEGKEGLSIKDASSHGKGYGNHVYNLNHVGIYVDAEAEHLFDIEVYQNLVHDIEAMGFSLASEQGGLLEDIRLYNNLAYNNLVGLWLSACCITTHPFQDITISNNTLAYNGRDGWGGGIGIENTQVQSVVIRNNICSQNTYSQMAADPSILPELVVDHNLTDGDRDPEFEFYGVGDLVDESPSFVNRLLGNYHLQAGSPAIDQGSAVDAPADDLDGRPRPWDGDGDGTAGYDIGAYEAGAQMAYAVYLPLVIRNR